MTVARLVVGVLLLATALGTSAVPAGAVGAVESGWWWRAQPSDGALPAPPHVPDGGLRIASDASGPSAVAAVRIALSAGETSPVLTLEVAAGSAQSATITACPPAAAWTAVDAGAWSSRPEPDCAGGAAAGSVADDGTAVVFDLSPITPAAGGDVIDVVLFTTSQPLPVGVGPTPLPVPESVPATIDVAFARPDATDVAVTASGAGAGGDEFATSPQLPAFDLGATTALEVPLGAALDLGLLGPSTPPAAAPAALPARRAQPPAAGVAAPLQRLASAWDRVGEARDRLLAAFVFVDLLAGWWLLERRRTKVVDPDARPRITLHDDPAAVLAAHRAAVARRPSLPTIDVPPLR